MELKNTVKDYVDGLTHIKALKDSLKASEKVQKELEEDLVERLVDTRKPIKVNGIKLSLVQKEDLAVPKAGDPMRTQLMGHLEDYDLLEAASAFSISKFKKMMKSKSLAPAIKEELMELTPTEVKNSIKLEIVL